MRAARALRSRRSVGREQSLQSVHRQIWCTDDRRTLRSTAAHAFSTRFGRFPPRGAVVVVDDCVMSYEHQASIEHPCKQVQLFFNLHQSSS
jgi:hypothetical protein